MPLRKDGREGHRKTVVIGLLPGSFVVPPHINGSITERRFINEMGPEQIVLPRILGTRGEGSVPEGIGGMIPAGRLGLPAEERARGET